MDFLNALKSVVTSIKNWVNEKLKKKVDVVEGKGLSTNDLTDDLLDKINSFDGSIAAAKKAGDDAQTEVDALETKVGNIPDGSKATTVIGYINEKTENTTSDSAMQELANRVTELEKQVSGNLLKAPITITKDTVLEGGPIISLDYSLGLEIGKSYKVNGTFGANNTVLDATIKYKDTGGGDMYALEWYYPDIYNPEAYFNIYDKLYYDVEVDDLVARENSAIISVGFDNEAYVPFTITSITEAVEVVEYATKESVDNLSEQVNSIEERLIALEKGDEPVNLLSAPIEVVPNLDPTNSGSLTHFISNLDTIGLVDMKDYNITYTYKGTQYTQKAQAQLKDNGTILFEGYQEDGSTSEATLTIDNSIVIQMGDKATIDTTTGMLTYSENSMAIMAYSFSSTGAFQTFEPITINSIVEVEAIAKPIVTFSAEDSDTYDESMGMYIKTLDTQVDTSAFAHNTKVKLNFTLNGEAMSIEGYMVKQTDDAGTYTEFISMYPAEDGKGAMLMLVYDEANQKGVGLMNYLNMNMLTEQPGVTFGFMTLGYDPLPTVEILGIEKAQEEYATKEYVDNLIAEINDKLETLYGGTEV